MTITSLFITRPLALLNDHLYLCSRNVRGPEGRLPQAIRNVLCKKEPMGLSDVTPKHAPPTTEGDDRKCVLCSRMGDSDKMVSTHDSVLDDMVMIMHAYDCC